MAEIFKAYDIRGIYGEELTTGLAEKIGKAFATFLNPDTVVVGRDMREHSEPLFKALAKGLTTQGVDVIDIGVCSTPMCYFATGKLRASGSIMITASHNPGEYNGFKLCRENAIPISGDTGIKDIQRIVESGCFSKAPDRRGSVSKHDPMPEYKKLVADYADLKQPPKVVADMANAMGVIEARTLEQLLQMDKLFDELDGAFPNHEANPLKLETLQPLQKKVKEGGYAFGIAFDGDADRAGFVDENGEIVPMDLVTALIAQDLLEKKKGIVLYDLRSSWSVKEAIAEKGGIPRMCRVGHAFIKRQMREHNAIFAGELSGHYYFKDNYYAESSALAAISIANILSKTGKSLSEAVKPLRKYWSSGEINSTVKDARAVLETLKKQYSDGNLETMDGIRIEFSDWWFNVRPSNTEPLVRLNLEAKTKDVMEEKREEVLSLIRR
ncbi:MAG: phosphomannomutase/phosphoglucomutase [Verrucomicrobiota bacterium]